MPTETGGARRLIIVDDDRLTLEVLHELGESWGYATEVYDNFEDGRSALLKAPAHALVVDVRLGAFNGLHLAHIARRQSPTMTVVAVSGFDDPVLREEAATINAAYLVKPVEPRTLRALLDPS